MIEDAHDIRYAVAMDRIAEHLEESKRVYARIEALEAMVAVQQEQMKAAMEFQADVKRVFWMIITGGRGYSLVGRSEMDRAREMRRGRRKQAQHDSPRLAEFL